MNHALLAAALFSLVICLIHLIAGGRAIASPLLADRGLPKIAKWTLYMCWHFVTITLLGMAAAYLMAALAGGNPAPAIFATIGAGLYAAFNLGMNILIGLRHRNHPQWMLFAPLAILGATGLWM